MLSVIMQRTSNFEVSLLRVGFSQTTMFENFLENRWAFLTDSNAFSSPCIYIRIALTRELPQLINLPFPDDVA